MNFLCDKYWYPHFRKEKEAKKKLRRKRKDLLLNIIIIMLKFVRRNFFRRKRNITKTAIKSKVKKQKWSLLKRNPETFYSLLRENESIIVKKKHPLIHIWCNHLPFYIVHYIIASKKNPNFLITYKNNQLIKSIIQP